MKIEIIKKSVKSKYGETLLAKGTQTLIFDDVATAVAHINQVAYLKTVKPDHPFCYEAYYEDGIDNKDVTLFRVLQYGSKAVIQIELREQNQPHQIRFISIADYKKYIDYSDFAYQDE